MTGKPIRAGWCVLPCFFLVFMSCGRCTLPWNDRSDGTLTLLSYNCQNVFDDVSNGSEYIEFDPGRGNWDSRMFHTRLMNLSEVIRSACSGGPDIVALQEIENLNVLETLTGEYLKGMGYRWIACVHEPGSAVNTGVLSRLPIEMYRAHRLGGTDGSVMRNVLEVRIETEDGALVLFNNHWKSKLGGAEETEGDRIRAAALVCRLIRETGRDVPGACVLVVGDLNENPDEYTRTGELYRTALMPAEGPFHEENDAESIYLADTPDQAGVTAERVFLYSPWSEQVGGSYAYRSGWERIDHVLMTPGFFDGGGIEFLTFSVMMEPFLLKDGDRPFGWSSGSAKGYSDHLPLILVLEVR